MPYSRASGFLTLLLTSLASALLLCPAQAADPIFPGPVTMAFLGDSITEQGAGSAGGYVRLVVGGLEANGAKITPVFAGISGNKSNEMLARLDRDVLSKKPDWMTLSCGVNDVGQLANGIPLDQYQKNITSIVEKAQAAGTRVMILTATVIQEDPNNAENQTLAGYNAFLKTLAAEKKCLLADLNTDMWQAIKAAKNPNGRLLTGDGVHMNIEGNRLMARGVLKAFGLNDAQLQKAAEVTSKVPNAASVAAYLSLTLGEYDLLQEAAQKQNTSVNSFLTGKLIQQVLPIIHPQPAK
jgi:lysophospholipase L1-like esterase